MILYGFALRFDKTRLVKWLIPLSIAIAWMFVLSANYGKGESPIDSNWHNAPVVFLAGYLIDTHAAESIWYHLLSSNRVGLPQWIAGLVTWLGLLLTLGLVWLVWKPRGKVTK